MSMAYPMLILFAKRPRPGYGKQRLAASIGAEAAIGVAEGLLDCALEDIRAWSGPKGVAVADPADQAWMKDRLAQPDIALWAQCDGNLGERLNHSDQHAYELVQGPRLFMGSDAPLLQSSDFMRCATCLEISDMVLADSEDGGVTLMGCNPLWPDLVTLPWSTTDLGSALADLGAVHRMTVARMAGGFDIDALKDLQRALPALATDTRQARRALYALVKHLQRTALGK